jgi:hypothetical protein
MGFFSNLWSSVKALVDSPAEFLADPVATTLKYKVAQMAESGSSTAEINAALENSGLKKGSVVYEFIDSLKTGVIGVGKLLLWITNHLSLILILAVIGVIMYYFLAFRKAG